MDNQDVNIEETAPATDDVKDETELFLVDAATGESVALGSPISTEVVKDPEKYKGYIFLEHSFNDRFKDDEVTIGHHFKKPTRPQIARVQKGVNKDAVKAFGNFVGDVVHPEEKDALAEHIKMYPGIAATFGNAILSSVGIGDLGN